MTGTIIEDSTLSCTKCGSELIKLRVRKTIKRKIKKTTITISFRVSCQGCGFLKKYTEKQFKKKIEEAKAE